MYNSLAQLAPIIKTENRDVTYHWGSNFTILDVIHAPTACKKKNSGRQGKKENLTFCRLTSVNPAEKNACYSDITSVFSAF